MTATVAPATRADFGADAGGPRRRGPRAAGRRCRARAGWSCRCRRWRRRSPWWVSTIRTPRSARSTSLLSSRISSTRAGSLPSTAASRRASAPGMHRGEAADAALGLGDDLLRDDDDVAVGELGARGDQLAERASPRSTSGRPADRARLAFSSRGSLICPAPSRSAWRGRGRASSSRVRATTSAGVSRSSASEASSSTPKGTPASRAAATWRAQLPSPKAGRIALGRRQHQRVGAGPVAVGDDGDVALGDAGQQAVELARVEQRAVAGEEDDAARPRPPRRAAIPASAASEWPSSAGSGTTSAPAAAASSARARLAADDDRPLDRARRADRLQHVVEHRRGQRRAPLVVDARRRGRCLAAAKRLTGRIAVAFNPRARLAA